LYASFQEQLLSRRTIIFINNQAYFRCHQRLLSEDTWADSRPTGDRDAGLGHSLLGAMEGYYNENLYGTGVDEADAVLAYCFTAIEAYQTRNLTEDSDAINAMMGILRPAASQLNTHLLEGLPVAAFDIAILFVTSPSEQTQFRKDTKVRRRLEFPSWSWAGWAAGLSFTFHMSVSYDEEFVEGWLKNRSWIVWYRFHHGHSTQPVRGLEGKSPFKRLWKDMIYERSDKRHPRHQFGNLNIARSSPSKCCLAKPYSLLVFFTVSITLKIRDYNLEEFNGCPFQTSLYDSKDSFCGLLVPDILECAVDGREVELIVLSENPDKDHNGPTRTMSKYHEYERQEKEKGLPDLARPLEFYLVMLIEWVGDVYERRGLGEILKTSVKNSLQAGPQWKEIILG
jgi:hypothetical protein